MISFFVSAILMSSSNCSLKSNTRSKPEWWGELWIPSTMKISRFMAFTLTNYLWVIWIFFLFSFSYSYIAWFSCPFYARLNVKVKQISVQSWTEKMKAQMFAFHNHESFNEVAIWLFIIDDWFSTERCTLNELKC